MTDFDDINVDDMNIEHPNVIENFEITSIKILFQYFQKMWHACPVDLIPFFFTFIFTLRSSSTGLVVGIFCHLIMALGKFIMPIDRSKSHENTIYLEGAIMFPSGDVSFIYR